MMNSNSMLLSVVETAELLRVSEEFIYALAKAGVLPSVRIGRRRMVRRADIAKFIEKGAPDVSVRGLRQSARELNQ
jgi:excisionase family DNA binding protein